MSRPYLYANIKARQRVTAWLSVWRLPSNPKTSTDLEVRHSIKTIFFQIVGRKQWSMCQLEHSCRGSLSVTWRELELAAGISPGFQSAEFSFRRAGLMQSRRRTRHRFDFRRRREGSGDTLPSLAAFTGQKGRFLSRHFKKCWIIRLHWIGWYLCQVYTSRFVVIKSDHVCIEQTFVFSMNILKIKSRKLCQIYLHWCEKVNAPPNPGEKLTY